MLFIKDVWKWQQNLQQMLRCFWQKIHLERVWWSQFATDMLKSVLTVKMIFPIALDIMQFLKDPMNLKTFVTWYHIWCWIPYLGENGSMKSALSVSRSVRLFLEDCMWFVWNRTHSQRSLQVKDQQSQSFCNNFVLLFKSQKYQKIGILGFGKRLVDWCVVFLA